MWKHAKALGAVAGAVGLLLAYRHVKAGHAPAVVSPPMPAAPPTPAPAPAGYGTLTAGDVNGLPTYNPAASETKADTSQYAGFAASALDALGMLG